ncbi:hypothetical protein [Pseudarthrobacter phenanthrenivorans]|uniref:Uncharacterized protein n=1 Tax=Pseudarthrobacter phenanthrenivorans TaxID=361575 RepID=A0A0B4DIU6_PSEPS|nr:hypothetical protein [Pseudarthrobacter phenanthrenivorans]KIC68732.1 hypothetical protein RM50_04580 [Pseudarthrobacter phenanthrenivorans]
MAGTVTSIATRYPTERLLTVLNLLADEQVKAECFGTPLPDTAWFYVCELESRLPELRLLLDTVAEEDPKLTVEHLNDILIAAEAAIETHSPAPTAA